MRSAARLCLLVAPLLLAACSGDLAEPIASEPAPGPEAASTLLRVDLTRGSAGTAIAAASLVELSAGASPIPALGGDVMVVAYAGDAVHDAVPVQFPKALLVEGVEDDGRPFREEVDLDESDATAFLRYGAVVDRVDVLADDGEVLASMGGAALPALRASAVRPRAGGERVGEVASAVLSGGIANQFPAIRFLEPGDEKLLPKGLRDRITAIAAIDEARAPALAQALERVAPAARGAMSTVAIVTIPPSPNGKKTLGIANGSAFVANESVFANPPDVVRTVVHEGAHNYTYLVGAAAEKGDGLAKWPKDVQNAAREKVAAFRLAGGLSAAWGALHATAVDAKVAGTYYGEAWGDVGVDAANASGFATPYGGSKVNEDIAEYTQRIQAPEGGETPLCKAIAAAGSPFPAELALPYAKAKLLEGVGLIEPARLEACIGDPPIQGPPGIHLGDAIHFEDGLKAGWLDQDGGHFFAVLGEGPKTYGLLLRVLSPDEHPLGVHRLDSISLGNLHQPNNAVYLKHDVPEKARASAGGIVLVTSATAARVEGALLFLSLQNGFGQTTDRFPISTFLLE